MDPTLAISSDLEVSPRKRLHGLFFKFLMVMVPVFLVLSVPGTLFVIEHQLRSERDGLAARIGGQAARVAAILSRHGIAGDGPLARDLLSTLSNDPAFVCGELKSREDDRVLAKAPAYLGCGAEAGGFGLEIPVGEPEVARLMVRFDDVEIRDAETEQRNLTFLLVGISFLMAIMAAGIGFRAMIGRPLGQLLRAISYAATTGVRRPLNHQRSDELGVVMDAYNDLVTQDTRREAELRALNTSLTASQIELRDLNETLEERIEKRTAQVRGHEAELFESEQRFRHFAEASADWYWEMDADLRFSYFSEQFENVTGVGPGNLLGKTRDESGLLDVDPLTWQQHLASLKEKRSFRNFVHPRRMPDGSRVWLSVSGIPYFDKSGEFLGFRGVGRDITAQREAQLALEQSRLDLEAAQRVVQVGSWRRRIDNDQILSCTDEFARMHGLDAGLDVVDLTDQTMQFVHPDDIEELYQRIDEVRRERRNYDLEYRIIRPDGSLRYLLEHGRFFSDGPDAETEYLGTTQDITELKQREIDLAIAKAAAEQANRAKSEFVANMSHELRTPLNAIIGYSEMLLEEAEANGSDETAGDLKRIMTSGKHLFDLIGNILEISKIETGKIDLHLEPVALEPLIAEVVVGVEPQMNKNGNEFVVDQGARDLVLQTDAPKLRQVLLNLLGNAAKFTQQGRVTLSTRPEGQWLLVSVTDSGIGMSDAQLSQVFQPFVQADNTITKRFGGTGLGLAISQRIVQQMGGRIELESEPGKGSCFSVWLPLVVREASAA